MMDETHPTPPAPHWSRDGKYLALPLPDMDDRVGMWLWLDPEEVAKLRTVLASQPGAAERKPSPHIWLKNGGLRFNAGRGQLLDFQASDLEELDLFFRCKLAGERRDCDPVWAVGGYVKLWAARLDREARTRIRRVRVELPPANVRELEALVAEWAARKPPREPIHVWCKVPSACEICGPAMAAQSTESAQRQREQILGLRAEVERLREEVARWATCATTFRPLPAQEVDPRRVAIRSVLTELERDGGDVQRSDHSQESAGSDGAS